MSNETRELIHQIPIDNDFPEAAGVLAMTAQQAVLPRKLEDGQLYAVLRGDRVEIVETPGYTHQHSDERAVTPRLVHRKVVVTTPESLIDYLTANTDQGLEVVGSSSLYTVGGLEVWADLDRRNVTAIIDGGEGWRKHTATLQLAHSREWIEWSDIDGKLLPQARFAEFIEDHLSSIGSPDGAELLDVCQSLQANTKVSFKSQQILANGQRQFVYEETVEAKAGQKGTLKIPAELTLVLRPFAGGDPIGIQARFRFRLHDGELTLGVRLAEPEKAVEDAFEQVVVTVTDAVPVPVLYGRG